MRMKLICCVCRYYQYYNIILCLCKTLYIKYSGDMYHNTVAEPRLYYQ